ncbi:hypothetical protein Ciccas_010859 [Cichlidogyrus casuarinus]|uniref:Uncharacterized protein n=1 Tax=Cichlidogyrus casuarinus TaxID=1844966 RepID=A0ABD2PU29_9PLAT
MMAKKGKSELEAMFEKDDDDTYASKVISFQCGPTVKDSKYKHRGIIVAYETTDYEEGEYSYTLKGSALTEEIKHQLDLLRLIIGSDSIVDQLFEKYPNYLVIAFQCWGQEGEGGKCGEPDARELEGMCYMAQVL